MREQQWTAAQRAAWRENWLSSIAEFADLELQRKTWLDPESDNPHWSFVEFMCCYFNDLNLTAGYGWVVDRALVTSEEVAAVRKMHAALDACKPPGGDEYDHARILDDPAWLGVVETAKEARSNLTKVLADPGEKRVLAGCSGPSSAGSTAPWR
ncbi:MAG: hypothetical protein OEM59_03090 [Rhodospirillales bacterium]|nr:hypothetical protein [Rhodospirillales bacterium]